MYSSSVIEGLTLTNLGGLSPQSPPLTSPLVEREMENFEFEGIYDTFPMGNVGKHCATPKRLSIGLKIFK